ncbi:hypothetical protein [Streptomyces sp. NPDC093707]|uniref:hypothetical protein n=1 Tax=Streptomyces sp. NPDC093707 TaxID=3154984 RepID=UPI00344EDE6F
MLSNEWDRGPLGSDGTLTKWLKGMARRAKAAWKPLWERTVNHEGVQLLSQPLSTNGQLEGTLGDTLTSPSTETVVLHGAIEDMRVHHVLDKLAEKSELDLRIALAWAKNPDLTWTTAAKIAGAECPHKRGERVRRKLRRLGSDAMSRRSSVVTGL